MKIPGRYRWDGSSNHYTKNCSSCQWYRKIEDSELCGWGAAFKYLIRVENMRKCEIRNRPQPEHPSVEYLDEIIAALSKQKTEFAEQNPSLDSFSTD